MKFTAAILALALALGSASAFMPTRMSISGSGSGSGIESRRAFGTKLAGVVGGVGVGAMAPSAALAVRPPKFVNKQEGFYETKSGLQIKDAKQGTGKECAVGDRAVYEWEGYTIGYFGRPFEAKGGVKGGAFQSDQDYDRFIVGRGQVVPALEEAIVGMKEGGVRQLVFGTDLGYPFIGDEQEGKLVDPGHDKVGPKPHTFSGMRALNFVLENKGDNVDKTLLLNVKLVRVDQKGSKSF